MKKKNKLKPKWGRDPESQLLKAAARYIEANGGKVFVIGGLQIQQWAKDNEGNYLLAIKFTGNAPKT